MKMLINGLQVDAAGGSTFDVINPATGQIVDQAPLGGAEDVGAAIDAAEEAFGKWSGETARERGKILFKAAQITRSRVKDLATMLTTEQGKPFKEATGRNPGLREHHRILRRASRPACVAGWCLSGRSGTA